MSERKAIDSYRKQENEGEQETILGSKEVLELSYHQTLELINTSSVDSSWSLPPIGRSSGVSVGTGR